MGSRVVKVRFFHKALVNFGSLWAPYLLKVGDFRRIFEGLSLDVYLVVVLWGGAWVSK